MVMERRRHPRKEIAIEVRVLGNDDNGKSFEEVTLSGDITSVGCSLLLSCKLAAGSELELEFRRRLPGKQEPVLYPFRGIVVRAAPINDSQYIVGIQFLNALFPIDVLDSLPSL